MQLLTLSVQDSPRVLGSRQLSQNLCLSTLNIEVTDNFFLCKLAPALINLMNFIMIPNPSESLALAVELHELKKTLTPSVDIRCQQQSSCHAWPDTVQLTPFNSHHTCSAVHSRTPVSHACARPHFLGTTGPIWGSPLMSFWLARSTEPGAG